MEAKENIKLDAIKFNQHKNLKEMKRNQNVISKESLNANWNGRNDLSSEKFSTNKQTKLQTNKQNKKQKKVDRMVPLQRMTREQNKKI